MTRIADDFADIKRRMDEMSGKLQPLRIVGVPDGAAIPRVPTLADWADDAVAIPEGMVWRTLDAMFHCDGATDDGAAIGRMIGR